MREGREGRPQRTDDAVSEWPQPTGDVVSEVAPPDDLPGWLRPLALAARDVRAHQLSRFVPPAGGGRRSAVLILLGEEESGPTVLITERSHTLRAHAGQPSFPGGRLEGAESPVAAALRETAEETGLDPAGVQVVAVLPDLFLPVGGSVVTPVVAWWRTPAAVRVVDAAEVASVHVVPLAELADPVNRLQARHPSGFLGPAFTAGGLLIWGFTAGLLDRILHLGGFERPWDTTRVEPLPDDVVALARRDRGAEAVPALRDERP